MNIHIHIYRKMKNVMQSMKHCQKLWHKTCQHMSISRPFYLHFILTLSLQWSVKICYVFF